MAVDVKIQDIVGGLKATPVGTDTLEIQETANGDSYYATIDGIRLTVTTPVTYTVAADGDPAGIKDFDSFEEAIAEIVKYATHERGSITLSLEDGQHIISDIHSDSANSFNFINTRVIIDSVSGIAANCTIAFASGSIVTTSYFSAAYNSLIWIQNITLDPRVNGGSQQLFSFFTAYLSSRVSFFDCIVNRMDTLSAIDSGTLLLNNTTVSNAISYGVRGVRGAQIFFENTCVIDSCDYGMYLVDSSNCNLTSGTLTISNSATAGVWLRRNCTASFRTGSLTFSGNTLDSNNPINELSVENELLSDGDAPIYHKAKINYQNGTAYTITAADNAADIVFDNAAAIAVTLPDTLDINFRCTISQVGAGVPTVTRSGTDTINGGAGGVTPSAQWKGIHLAQYAAGTWLARV